MFKIPARVNFITLGVSDLAVSSSFYERLGWRRKARAFESDIRFFVLDNLVLGLFVRTCLAADAGVSNAGEGFGGVTLSINLSSEADVDAAFQASIACGAKAVKAPVRADWGGYSGYFGDPDLHLWELAFNPFFPLRDDGGVDLPD